IEAGAVELVEVEDREVREICARLVCEPAAALHLPSARAELADDASDLLVAIEIARALVGRRVRVRGLCEGVDVGLERADRHRREAVDRILAVDRIVGLDAALEQCERAKAAGL